MTKNQSLTVEGPIPDTADSKPLGSNLVPGSRPARLMNQYDYVEEEYFISGRANIYGPAVKRSMRTGEVTIPDLKALVAVKRQNVSYKTRLLIIRPRNAAAFSGNVHLDFHHPVAPFPGAEVHLLRNGDIWMGLEVTASPPEALAGDIPSGGIANYLRYDKARYGDLVIAPGQPEDWPDLQLSTMMEVLPKLSFGADSFPVRVVVQEIGRNYAQAPDIITQVAHLVRESSPQSPISGHAVRRMYTSGASQQSYILRQYIDHHHETGRLPDGRPAFDGYMVLIGSEPTGRPKDAVIVLAHSEREAMMRTHAAPPSPDFPEFHSNSTLGGDTSLDLPLPADTDQPKFRYYELPATGHMYSAPLDMPPSESVIPKNLQDIFKGAPPAWWSSLVPPDLEPYDKINFPIIWALWDHLYEWVENGTPMPRAPRIVRDPNSPDGIARDKFGNALGGLRTPWVDVPDARYFAHFSTDDPMRAGMQPFSEEKMNQLYGSRDTYIKKVNERIDQMVQDGWVLAEDADLMRIG